MPIIPISTSTAAIVASNLASRINQLANQINTAMNTGVAANANQAACTGAEIATALGATALAQLDVISAAASSTDGTKLGAALAALK
jgi:hypothetical protein